MGVISTNRWLRDYLKEKGKSSKDNLELQKSLICKKLERYFKGASSHEIHEHLMGHGLFPPSPLDYKLIKQMFSKNYWKTIKKEYDELKSVWNGPDVPIFLFPANTKSKELRVDLNGISGITHQDKVFLFASDFSTENDLRALITHEYNHICRLDYLNQKEENIPLLDSIILEGLAENAVEERLSTEHTGKWTDLYSKDFAIKCFKRWIEPNLQMEKKHFRHLHIMYGKGQFPRWLGYSVGYHIVNTYLINNKQTISSAIYLPADEILNGSDFGN